MAPARRWASLLPATRDVTTRRDDGIAMTVGAVVDAHAHVFRAVSAAYPRAVRALYPADSEMPVERLLERMEEAGVEHAVLVAVSPDDCYVGECARRDPRRFAAVTVHDPARPGPDQVDRRCAEGYRAIRLETLGDPAEHDVERLAAFPLLERMAQTAMVAWLYGPLAQLRVLGRIC